MRKIIILLAMLTLPGNTVSSGIALRFSGDQCKRIEIEVESCYAGSTTIGVRCLGCGIAPRVSAHTVSLKGGERQTIIIEWALYGVELPLDKIYYLEAFEWGTTVYARGKARPCPDWSTNIYLPMIYGHTVPCRRLK